jgi:protein-S-isoprenylcysteine O-methyltransferase Ste14
MLARAIAAFLLLPGFFAFSLPIAIAVAAHRPRRHVPVAVAVIALGTAFLLLCVREFYAAGRGTLASWWPPEHLVTSGPYRLSRNPMYVSVLTILLGWWLLWDSRTLMVYALVIAAVFHVHVVLAEEPWAARTFDETWKVYRNRVPRWLILIKPRAYRREAIHHVLLHVLLRWRARR